MEENNKNVMPLYVISGGKGVAGHTMVHSLIIQYPDFHMPVKVIPEIQTEEKIEEVVLLVKKKKGLLTHTMVNSVLRNKLIESCRRNKVDEIDLMGPLANYLEKKFGLCSVNVPGLYRRVNAKYFDRIEAIEYTLQQDDGINLKYLNDAEIILTGVSRSGKTPLSVYMSMFGWKTANVPLVKGIEPPDQLFQVDPRKVFGLDIGTRHLISQRYKRLKTMNDMKNTDYVDEKKVSEELNFARMIFTRGEFTVINITNKPIESSANEIIGYISERFRDQEINRDEAFLK